MSIGHRTTGAVAAVVAVAALSSACGGVRVVGSTAAMPSPAASAVLRAAVTDHCPARPPARLTSDVSGTAARVEPLAADRLLLCGYGPVRPDAGVAHALVTGRGVVAGLRAGFNSLGPVPKERFACPNDTGATVIAVFTDGVREVELRDAVSGCPTVTNGSLTAWVGGSHVNATVLALLHHTVSGG